MVNQLNAAVGRNDVDVVGLQSFRLVDLYDGHAGPPAENFRQPAAVIRIKMHHHDEGGACIAGKGLEEPLQGCDAARRGSDRHDGRFCGASLWLANALVVSVVLRHGTPALHPQLAQKFQIMAGTPISEKLQNRAVNSHSICA